MSNKYTSIISAGNLKAILSTAPLILDCRHQLGDAQWGRAQYLDGHIATAQHADMDADLAGSPGELGRHPLPDRQAWIAKLKAWGLNNRQQVVVYDDHGGAFAARAWWMLRWVGHAEVAVLDGGLDHWDAPLITDTSAPESAGNFVARKPLTTVVTAEHIEATVALQNHGTASMTLLDARAKPRWAGYAEPIDPVAGHIPGAVCLPHQENLTDQGTFLPASALQEHFADFSDPVVCYCGSGVTACHNILAMYIAGREAALFVDSWSGWITDSRRPVARADTKSA